MNDPYPYSRGMVSEIGYATVKIEYTQNRRERGITKNNFYTLYDMAMLGITSHSKVPLRLATMLGFAMSAMSLLVAVGLSHLQAALLVPFFSGHRPAGDQHFLFSAVQLFLSASSASTLVSFTPRCCTGRWSSKRNGSISMTELCSCAAPPCWGRPRGNFSTFPASHPRVSGVGIPFAPRI